MKLYHGTSYKYFSKILLNGIIPRDDNRSNWANFPSRSDMIYLTTTYPFTFAYCAGTEEKEKGVVFEIDLMSLDHDLIYPDEDFIWETTKEHHKSISSDILHKNVKENIKDFRHFWAHSLSNLGNCSYSGIIKPEAIERACVVDWRERNCLACEVLEPTITVSNHKFLGDHYRMMVQWFFGDIKKLPQVERSKGHLEMFPDMKETYQPSIDFWISQSKLRTGITVVDFGK